MSASNNEKREAVGELLRKGATQIVINPRREGVRLPPAFADQLLVRLNVSHRYAGADLKVDWWGVRQTLTFDGGRFACHVPWEAVFAMGDPRRIDRHRIWPADAPDDLQRELKVLLHLAGLKRLGSDSESTGAPTAPAAAPRVGATRAFTPRVIEGEGRGQAAADPSASGAAPATDEDDGEDPPPGDQGGRPALRVVK